MSSIDKDEVVPTNEKSPGHKIHKCDYCGYEELGSPFVPPKGWGIVVHNERILEPTKIPFIEEEYSLWPWRKKKTKDKEERRTIAIFITKKPVCSLQCYQAIKQKNP